MELLSVIRRWHYRDQLSIREIARRTGLSRNTVRKYLRSDDVEAPVQITEAWADMLPTVDERRDFIACPLVPRPAGAATMIDSEWVLLRPTVMVAVGVNP